VTTTLTLNGLDAKSVRLFQPWTGVWTAEVDFDLELVPVAPFGPATLVIGTTVLVGTIDPTASGKFGDKAIARVIGGGGGWGKIVSSRQFHNDAGVLPAAVIIATAAEALEPPPAVTLPPVPLGVDYERTSGAASRVLAGLDWYVTLAGVTTVGAPRPQLPANPLDVDVLTYDPFQRRAEIATDTILMPGTILAGDPRFDTLTIRDVEQTFTPDGGARASAWCGDDAKPRLATLLAGMVAELGGTANLKPYHYRVVAQNPADGRLTLQAVVASAGAPDSIAISPWYGVPGVKATVLPGTEVAVKFLNGDPAKPVVDSFKPAIISAPSPVARATAVASLVSALETFAAAMALASTGPLSALAGPCTDLGTAVTALAADVSSQTLQVD
jgi:hypothetical protein